MVKQTPSNKTTKKPFDKTAFVFETEISKIEEWMQRMEDQCEDPDAEWPTEQELMWYATWLRDIDYYKNHGLTKTLCSAQECAVLGLYEKPKRKTKTTTKKK